MGFEPTVPLPGQLLSRQPDSATLAPLRQYIKPSISAAVYYAEDGTRTRTGFHPQAPQACVSTNSTTSASYIKSYRWIFYIYCYFVIYCFVSVPGGFFSPVSLSPVSEEVFSWVVPGSVDVAGLSFSVSCCCSVVSPLM